ncbi:MAG: tetratricopeptide repeat protein [Planctomycetes bacterium]|nr:tetratricopeptide repeat protein [Planctomycetota bacterium]
MRRRPAQAALAAAEVLAPERLGLDAGAPRRRGPRAPPRPRTPAGRAALTRRRVFERARAAGAPPREVDATHADVLMDLGRLEEALAVWDRALAHSADHWWAWLRRGLCFQDLGRPDEALEAMLGALSFAPARADLQEAVLALAGGAPPGLAGAALVALADARGEPTGSPVWQAALERARLGQGDGGRDGDLARYVLARSGAAPPPSHARPTAVLAGACAGDARARDELAAAARRDRLVLHLARLDPALAPLLE